MSMLVTPQAVLFDWDNTLVDTWPTIHAALNLTLAHMNHAPWSLAHVKATVKNSMRESFPALFGDRWQEAATHYQNSYRAIHLDHLHALPQAEETLQWLRARHQFLGIVSNKRGETLRIEMQHLGWQHYFDVAIGAGDATRDKPSADPALLALTAYRGAQGNAVWFVGDTGVDLACAAAIGATAILYGPHITDGRMHDGHGFAAHAHDHSALQALLAGADQHMGVADHALNAGE